MKTTPYVVQPGDYLLKLSLRYGFDADRVWNLPANKRLRDQKREPHMLADGDVLFIPDEPRKWLPVKTGADNTYTATMPKVAVNVKLLEGDKASKGIAYTVEYPGTKLNGVAKDDGVVSFEVPISVAVVILTVPGHPPIPMHLAHLDPINTESGLMHRLAHLKHADARRGGNRSEMGEALRAALLSFQGASKLPLTGTADEATVKALLAAHGV